MNFSTRLFLMVLSLLMVSAGFFIPDQPHRVLQEDTEVLIHNVYFYLNEDVSQEEIEQFEAGLEVLLNIPEIHKAEMGIPAETKVRDVTDHDFVYSIYTRFKTMGDYEIYAEHPDHKEFIKEYSHLWSNVKVYDSEIIFER